MSTLRLKGLDGLRAFAALAVFGVHYNQIVDIDHVIAYFDIGQLLANGEVGVLLFFSLSGFLLSLPFWSHYLSGTKKPNIKRYIMRRLARVMPAYYVCLTLLILFNNHWRLAGSFTDIALHYSYLFNWFEFSILSINAPFWTLATEMQFYLILPLFMLWLGRGHSLLKMGVLILASYTIHFAVQDNLKQIIAWPWNDWQIWLRPHGAVISQSLFAHLPHFLLGTLAAWFTTKHVKAMAQFKYADLVFWISL